ncbi:ABC transporter substrate-binding protein, partial [Chloroflexota bacterium]
ITKTATAVDTAGDGIINNAGEIIEYTVEVENTGNITITSVSVTDSLSITLTHQADDPGNDDADLEEGEIWVYTGSYTVQQSDLDAGSIENTATVSSNDLGDKSATKEITCGTTPFTGDVKIGVLLPLSGMAALYGDAVKAGIEFVIEEMEAEGALNGADIEVVWADDEFDSIRAATEMVRLCTEENVCAVIGPLGTQVSLSSAPLADTYEVPNLNLGGGGDLIDMGLSYWHSISPERSTGDYGRTWVDFIQYCIDNYDLPHDRIALSMLGNSDGEKVRSAVLERLEYYGLDDNIVLDLSIDTTATSMDTYVLQCKAEDPDIHIMFEYANYSAMWVGSMYTLDYYPPFFIGSPEFVWYSFSQLFVQPDVYNAVFNEEHNTPFATPVAYENIAIDSCREFLEEFSDWCAANGKPDFYSLLLRQCMHCGMPSRMQVNQIL